MPIVFEQPQAIAPAISSAYGAGEQAMSDFPAIAQAYGNAARMNQATNLASAENATRMAMANAQNIQQGGMFAGQLAQRQREADQQQQMHNDQIVNAGVLQQQQAQAHLIAQQQAAQLNAWVSQQDITFKEQQQLNLLKSKVADVQNDPNLSADEKTRILSMIKYKVDPLQMKAQATQQRMQEQQMKLMQQREAQAAAIKHLNDAYSAGNVNALPLFTDPLTGQQHRMLMNHQGEWYDPFTKARADAAKAQGKPEKQADQFGFTPQDYLKQQQSAAKEVDGKIKDGTLKPEQRKAAIAEVMKDRGFKPSLAEHFPPQVKPNPFSVAAPKTEAQRGFAQDWGMRMTQIRQSALPPEKKQLAEAAWQQQRGLVERYGIGAAPPEVQDEIKKLDALVTNLLNGEAPPAAPPAAPSRSLADRITSFLGGYGNTNTRGFGG